MSAQPVTYHCPIPECSTTNGFTFPFSDFRFHLVSPPNY